MKNISLRNLFTKACALLMMVSSMVWVVDSQTWLVLFKGLLFLTLSGIVMSVTSIKKDQK